MKEALEMAVNAEMALANIVKCEYLVVQTTDANVQQKRFNKSH
jgi:hypothetical protein